MKKVYFIFVLLSLVMTGCHKVSVDAFSGATPLAILSNMEDCTFRLAVNDFIVDTIIADVNFVVGGELIEKPENMMVAAEFYNSKGILWQVKTFVRDTKYNVAKDYENQYVAKLKIPVGCHKQILEAQKLDVVGLRLTNPFSTSQETASISLASSPVVDGPAAVLLKDFDTRETKLQISNEMLDVQKGEINVGYLNLWDKKHILLVRGWSFSNLDIEPPVQDAWGMVSLRSQESASIHAEMVNPDSNEPLYILLQEME